MQLPGSTDVHACGIVYPVSEANIRELHLPLEQAEVYAEVVDGEYNHCRRMKGLNTIISQCLLLSLSPSSSGSTRRLPSPARSMYSLYLRARRSALSQ